MSREALKQSLITEAAIQSKDHPSKDARTFAKSVHEYLMAEQPARQEPVAYDKTEINCFAQDLYDHMMRGGKHGHYESMFHVIHQCIKKVSPPAQRTWVDLTDEQIDQGLLRSDYAFKTAEAWRAGVVFAMTRLKEKNT